MKEINAEEARFFTTVTALTCHGGISPKAKSTYAAIKNLLPDYTVNEQ